MPTSIHPSITANAENTGSIIAPTLTGVAGASQESLAATFAADPRIHFSTVTRRWAFEDDAGNEWEYDALKGVWVQVVDEELMRNQQAAYSVPGVDEEAPAAPILKRLNKKRKEPEDYTSATTPQAGLSIKRGKNSKNSNPSSLAAASSSNSPSSSQQQATAQPQPPPPPPPRKTKNTAVYVSRLPPDTTPEELAARFGRCGVLEEDDDGDPKIKLYARDDGSFSGEALIVYFKEESVALAVAMLDEAELRVGDPATVMSVSQAEFGHKGGKEGNANANTNGGGGGGERRTVDKKKATKRIGRMQKKLEDWGSDDDFGPSADAQEDSQAANKNNRVVVLKKMFTLDQLAEDASLLLDLKEDVREECSALGEVTNVVLYDEEPEGIMTVKFRDPISAQACILKMQGRYFDGRRIEAFLYNGKQRYERSGTRGDFGIDGESKGGDTDEKKRLDEFANWLMTEGD